MRVGMVCYAVKQGLGYLAKSFYDNGVVDDVVVFQHPRYDKRPTQLDWYPKAPVKSRMIAGPRVEEFLGRVDVVMFFETAFDWPFLGRCKEAGVKTVLVSMYEWYPIKPAFEFDKIFAPSLLDQDYFPDSVFIPIPVESKYWQQRHKAIKFLHNAGNIGCREHKGTRQLLEAIPLIESDAVVTVRAQDERALLSIVEDTKTAGLPNLKLHFGEIPYEKLWEGYDVLVAPEKFNGLSLPLQEARAAGMLVMTTDRYPVNTWLPPEGMIPTAGTRRAQVSRGHLEFDESIVNPEDIAAAIDMGYGQDISEYSLSAKLYNAFMSWEKLRPVYLEELEKVCQS